MQCMFYFQDEGDVYSSCNSSLAPEDVSKNVLINYKLFTLHMYMQVYV